MNSPSKGSGSPASPPPQSGSAGCLVVIVAAALAGYFAYTRLAHRSAPPPQSQSPSSYNQPSGREDDTDEPVQLPQLPEVQAADGSGVIRAAQGGMVTTGDGLITLQVPAGAVVQDVPVTLTHVWRGAGDEVPLLSEIALEPNGARFAQWAVLRVNLRGRTTGRAMSIYARSDFNQPRRGGGEISQFEPVANVTYDPGTGTLTVPLWHFSDVVLQEDWEFYLVFDIEGQYLKRGDVLCTMTGRVETQGIRRGATWFPGHSGIYLGTRTGVAGENDGSTVIESTPASPEYGILQDGVQFNSLMSFSYLGGEHIFMGARRPRFPLTTTQRDAIARYAIDLERQKRPYSSVARAQSASNPGNAVSCAGLTEAAYFAGTDRRIVTDAWTGILRPLQQFQHTVPVTDVAVPADTLYSMRLRGVLSEMFSDGINRYIWYFDNPEYSTMNVAAAPDDTGPAAQAIGAGRAYFYSHTPHTFWFRPAASDINKTFRFRFAATDARPQGHAGTRTADFTIRVTGPPSPPQTPVETAERPRLGPVVGWRRVTPENGELVSPAAAGVRFNGDNSLTIVDSGGAWNTLRWDPPPAEIVPGQTYTLITQTTANPGAPIDVDWESLVFPMNAVHAAATSEWREHVVRSRFSFDNTGRETRFYIQIRDSTLLSTGTLRRFTIRWNYEAIRGEPR